VGIIQETERVRQERPGERVAACAVRLNGVRGQHGGAMLWRGVQGCNGVYATGFGVAVFAREGMAEKVRPRRVVSGGRFHRAGMRTYLLSKNYSRPTASAVPPHHELQRPFFSPSPAWVPVPVK
jgi:hypothetical protein